MNIVPIREANALALDNQQIARGLRDAAAWVEAGDYGEVTTVAIVIERSDGHMERLTFGKPLDRARLVGLLAMMQIRLSMGVDQ